MGNPRILLFAALGFILLLMWQEWQKDYGPKATPMEAAQAPSVPLERGGVLSTDATAQRAQDELPTLAKDSVLTRMSAQQQEDQPTNVAELQDSKIRVITDKLDVTISLLGGEISAAALRAYPISLEDPDDPFVMLSRSQGQYYVAQTGLLGRQPAPNHLATYESEATEYRLAEGINEIRVPLYWQSNTGIRVTKTLIFNRGTHVIDIEQTIDNQSETAWNGSQYRQLVRTLSTESGGVGMVYTFNGAAYYSDEDKFEKIDFDDIDDDPLSKDVAGGWVGMIQHYFLTAWIPNQQETNNFYTRQLKGGGYAIGMISPEIRVEPGQQGKFTSRLYVGPKEQRVLEELATGLRLSVDYSWLTVIAQPIFWLMEAINNGVHTESIDIGGINNWGWSIIILTFLIKLVFFKLSEYGYRSMANMRRVQPKLVSIKERYGSDKKRIQQAMMELYKKEKINPMSGCLPILLQIPVFIALYWVLLESVELRQAPFILWITDLSVADPYFVLPLVMGITMFLQQKLNPAPMDETQKMIMKVLPVVFTVFFMFFPAGLVLYWVANNILSISQQWVITRRIEAGSAKA